VYCPECNEAALRKLVSAAAFRLKGTGWYETDFKGNGKKEDKSANGKSSDGGDTPTDKAGDRPNKADGKKSDSANSTGAKSSSVSATA